jgi:tetratricopeptide (TPR) repeat protein
MKSIAVTAGFLLVMSCAASYTSSVAPVIRNLENGNSQRAITTLKEVFPDSSGRDRLLYLMELGNLARYAGIYGTAQSILLQADRLSDNLRGTDFGQQAQSMISSDLALEFRGADYEKVFINYCLAASYAASGNTEDAAVEARRVNEKLKEINARYEGNPNRYTDDAFIRYFMGVLYEMDGDYDDALISYRLALATYDSVYTEDYGLSAPVQLKLDALRLADYNGFESLLATFRNQWPGLNSQGTGTSPDMGEIVAVVELGSISSRRASDYTFYVDNRVYSIALPIIPEFSRRRVTGSITAGGKTASMFLVEDLNGIARKNLEDEAGRNIARAAARIAVKAGLSSLGENVAEQLTDDKRVSSGVGLILSIIGAATEQADLRAWLTLPAQIRMCRMQVSPGSWPITVTVNGRQYVHDPVTVRAGEISLVFLREDI